MKWLLFTTLLLICNLIPTQQVSYQEKQAYFKKLLNLQQILQQKVENLQYINQHIIQNTESLKSHPDLQKVILYEGVKNQRLQIESTLSQTIIPLKQNTWTCKNLSPNEKDLIEQKIKDLRDKRDNIDKQLQTENNCQRNVELKSQLKVLKLHIDSLENQLSNTCQPPRKNDKFINNLNTDNNWIYGSLTPKDYQQQLNDLQNSNNLVQCDKNLPFLINNQCKACQKSSQIFSISEGKCIEACPTGKIFLKVNHECRDPKQKQYLPYDLNKLNVTKNPYAWGSITQKQYKDKVDELKKNNIPTEQCLVDKPFKQNGQSCTVCPSGQLYNIAIKACTTCKKLQKYLPNTHECKQAYKKPNYNAGKNWVAQNVDSKPVDNRLKQLQNQGFPVDQCPSDKPFPSKDLKSCVSCQKKYNLITGVCDQCNKFFIVKQGEHQCTFVTKDCPKDSFWTGQKCVKCLAPGHYDNNWRQCVCDQPLKLDQENGQCLTADKTVKNSNPEEAKNYIGTAPKSSKFLENCPNSSPFYDEASKNCVQCSLPEKYFNYDTKKCQQCDKNLEFSVTQKKCIQQVTVFNSNVGPQVNNYCCGEPIVDKTKDTCPNDTPFFDGYHCVSCSKPQYFDFKENKCKSCPTGQSFNTVTKRCVDSALLEPKFVSNIPSNVNNYIGKIPEEKPDTQGQQIIKCSSDQPFSKGKQCLSCELPRYFNFQSNQCQICNEGYSFSPSQRQCQKNTFVGALFYNSNMVNAENFIGKVSSYKPQYPQCLPEKRYFNGQACQSCDLPQYWNFDTNECKSCDTGLYFDKQARQCLYSSENQKYKTNIDASKNIYFNGDFEQVKKQVQNSGNKPQCPSEKPFFDKSSNNCINCEGDSYIFNYLKNHCMRCPDKTHFNEEYHICFQNGVEPTVERMVMNSVSWI